MVSAFAKQLIDARKAACWDQHTLATKLQLPPLMIRKFEQGELTPDANIRAKLDALFGQTFAACEYDFAVTEATHIQAKALVCEDDISQADSRLLDTRVSQLAGNAPAAHASSTPAGADPYLLQTRRGYLFLEAIGRGGFGSVYRAKQLSVGRDVAIKVINPELADDPDFIRRFESEAELIARLEHPFIVPLYDFWREPGAAFMVMRFLKGGSLAQALQKSSAAGGTSLIQPLTILRQLATALRVAHRADVVHRDIKPANILLDEQGNACLADFGVAKQLQQHSDRTQEGDIVGSLAYCSPEQLRGVGVGPASDVYALGLVAFELLTGRRPFAASSRETLIYQHLYQAPPSVREFQTELSERVDSTLNKALAKEIEQRYSDPLEFVSDLEAELRGHDTLGLGAVQNTEFTVTSQTQIALTDLDNPFVGLAAFDEANARNFFGRENLVAALLARLKEPSPLARALFVVGASGSGKSSVVRAGLIPALRHGGLPGSELWFYTTMVPGADPIESLAQALLRVAKSGTDDLIGLLRSSPHGLLRAMDRCVLPGNQHELVLLVDQFEELFTLTTDHSLRQAWITLITTAILDPYSRLRVIFTLRADFMDRPLQQVDLAELLRARCEMVSALSLEELERAVVGPAKRVGLTFEPGLVAAILAEADGEIGALPMLQYALSELYRERHGRELKLASFRKMGGIRGALAGRAEAAFAGLDAPARLAAEQLFLRLTTLGEGREDTRRRVLIDEFNRLTLDATAIQSALKAFADERLLTFDRDSASGQASVEVAHEALLRSWSRVQAWLAHARNDLRTQRMLSEAAREWRDANKQSEGYLAGSGRLNQFLQLQEHGVVQLTHDEQEFLTASQQFEERRLEAELARQQRELAQAQAMALQERKNAEAAIERTELLRRGRSRMLGMIAGLALLLIFAAWQGLQLSQRQAALRVQTERANMEAKNSAALSDFWRDLFKQADPNRAQGKELSVREVLDQGLERSKTTLNEAPAVKAKLLIQMGESYRSLGQMEQAITALDLADAAVKLVPAGDVDVAMRVALGLERGRTLADLARAPEALKALHDVQALQEQVNAPSLERATTLNIIASIYNDQNRFVEAEPLLRETLALREQGGSEIELTTTRNNLGFTLQKIGRAKQARELFEKVWAARVKELGKLHLDTVIAELNLADAERDLGNLAPALAHYDHVESVLLKLLGNVNHPLLVSMFSGRGATKFWLENFQESENDYVKAMNMQRAMLGADTPAQAAALTGIGRARDRLGKTKQALADVQQALVYATARIGGTNPKLAVYHLRLAEFALTLNQRDQARAALAHARALLSEADQRDYNLAVDVAFGFWLGFQLDHDVLDLDHAEALLKPCLELVRARKLLILVSNARANSK